MAKQRKTRPQPAPGRAGVTAERFVRLYRLVVFLGGGPKTRDRVLKHLRQDVRGFYRDLEALRAAGVDVALAEGRYALERGMGQSLARLPFPDPRLTLGEARQLARGRSAAHAHLREQIEQVIPPGAAPRR